MATRSAQLHRLARQYAARAATANDPLTKARFEQEAQHWLALAQKEDAERERDPPRPRAS
ncbi:MAG TPA: hypothetical protein VH678_28035 [Xanthobacteraceae bacterium]